jgi:hypothetical protein
MTHASSVIIAAFVVTGAQLVSAQRPATSGAAGAKPAPAAIARETTPTLLTGTRPDVLTTIQGNAVDSTNGQLANTMVRLRDARGGRIVESQLTDKAGGFAFKALDPGSYIVEMMATDQTVLTASQLINVNAGEAVSVLVKLPFRILPLAGVLNNTTPATAAAIIATAAASGVLATKVSGQPVTPGK